MQNKYNYFDFCKKKCLSALFKTFDFQHIYDLLLREKGHDAGRQVRNSIYSMATIFKEQPQTRDLNENFYKTMTLSLENLLTQMYDIEVPFRRTTVEKSCSYCDFRNICGK